MDTDALKPSPYDIWKEIERIPGTREDHRQMYLDRMREVGHIVPRTEADTCVACGHDRSNHHEGGGETWCDFPIGCDCGGFTTKEQG